MIMDFDVNRLKEFYESDLILRCLVIVFRDFLVWTH